MKVIVCGYGSIGKRYVELLKKKKIDTFIFDPKIKNKDKKITNCFNNFKSLKKTLNPASDKIIGIISSLSNNHLSNFKDLASIGVNKILIEKPLTDKLQDYDQILKIRNKKKIFVSSHYKWEAENLLKNILEVQKKYNTGKPFIFNCLAGSCCIATGAIHWIDFFSNFNDKDEDLEIFSNYDLDKINPRGKTFYQIGGYLYLKSTKSNITANFNFTNFSRLSPEISLIYKFHKIKFDIYGNYQVYRTPKKLDKLKITRYAKFSLIKKGRFKKNNNSLNVVLDNLLNSKKPLISLEFSFYALRILFLSFISNKLKKTINLKKFKTIFNKKKYYKKNFKFT